MGKREIMKETEMKKMLVLSLAVMSLLTLGVMVGCNKSPSGTPPTGQVASISMTSSHVLIRGFSGDIRTETITATARDVNGAAVQGVEIDFFIQNPQAWMGTIARVGDTLTDASGNVVGTYTVQIDRSTAVVLEARSGQAVGRITLNVEQIDTELGPISVEATPSILSVPPGQTRFSDVTARVTNTQGNALEGLIVRFRVTPGGIGIMSNDTGTTNLDGLVTRRFTSIVNQSGTATVTAQVGDSTGSAFITVQTVGAPAFLTIQTPNPTVEVAAGVNASVPLYVTVLDSSRSPVAGARLRYQVIGDPSFGAISAYDTTDINGRDSAFFNSLGAFGNVTIRCSVVETEAGSSPVSGEVALNIRALSAEIGSLTLRALPNSMTLPPDSLGFAEIRATVRNLNNLALPNVLVEFETDLGALSEVSVTDTQGVARAVFSSNYEGGTAHILATIPGTDFEATATIQVITSQNPTGILTISSNTSLIYADNGLSVARITALLKDQDNQALANRPIVFTSTHGAISSPINTNALGIVDTIFTDVGIPSYDPQGNIIPAKIYAKYSPLNLIDSVEVTIAVRNPVFSIAVTSQKNQMTAASGDSSWIRATATLLDGTFAPAGTLIQFEVAGIGGSFTQDAVPVTTFGRAETQYIAGNLVGTANIGAFVVNANDSIVRSNEVEIQLLPGPPNRINLQSFPSSLLTGDPGAFSNITATVSDTAGNPVQIGTLVRFTTTMGDVSPSALTDVNGRAVARLTPGVSSGVAEVTGSVTLPGGVSISNLTTVTFTAGYPNSIEMNANPLAIAVKETGGIETATLTCTVRDPNGNNIGVPTMVIFQLLNQPAVPNGSSFSNNTQIDSSRTANGIAVMTLRSGFQVGGVLIKAFTWKDPDTVWVDDEHTELGIWRQDTVSVVLSTVQVVAGPPAAIDIDVNDDGDDAGGGTWEIPVSARVYDSHRNPVADRIPVGFTCEPEDIATIDPGYTGNDIGAGATPGLAFTMLRYHSVKTFEPITIQAEVQVRDGVINAARQHTLPLQDGALELNVDPQNWMFDRGRPEDTCLVRVWVVLTDGHQITINKGPILFRTDRSEFYWRDQVGGRYRLFENNLVRKYTGIRNQNHNEEPGQATVFLRGRMSDFYLDDFTLEVTVHVEASVEGYDVAADPGFIFCTRH